MISGEPNYSFQAREDVLAQGRDNVVSMRVELGGSAVTVSAATFTLRSPNSDTPVISAANVSTLSPPTYTIPAASLAGTGNLGTGWQQIWALTIGGRVYTVDRETVVAIYPPAPTITQADLSARHADIGSLLGRGRTSAQALMDAAWAQIMRRWRSEGGAAWRLRTRDAFHDAHLFLTLSMLFMDIGKLNGNEALGELGPRYLGMYDREWTRVKGAIDWSDTGRPDDPDTLESPRADAAHVNAPALTWGGYGTGRRSYHRFGVR